MRRSWLLLLVLMIPVLAFASGTPIQESMLVTGTITLSPQGGVAHYSIQGMDKLPPAVQKLLRKVIPHWQFVPIIHDGKAVAASAGMSLRIVADFATLHARQGTVRVAGAAFGCEARPKSRLQGECPPGTSVMEDLSHRRKPAYPIEALHARVGGEVFLVLEIGRDGRVVHAAARQVNLYTLTHWPAHYRQVLAEASLSAARDWRFRVPITGPNATKDHWIVQIPIDYRMLPFGASPHRPGFGQWNVYLPGPVQHIPWSDQGKRGDAGADAIASGVPFVRDTRFILKNGPANASAQS